GVPFGFFPQKQERNSGFIFPEIGEEQVKGFFIRNGGYYFAINDYVDLRILAGWYTLGSWQVGLASNYSKRYTFSGNFSFDYASDKIGDKDSPDYQEAKNINIRWTHSQDPKFRPSSTFSASVNYSSSTYNKYNAQTMNDYLSSQTSSSITYQKNWAGTPFSLSINGSMSQHTRDSTITMNLPNISFNVARIAPFKRKVSLGKERWYEKISFTYNFDFKNEISALKEKYFMKKEMFDQMRMGIHHTIPVSASFNVLQYLNISPSVNYNERWYFRRIDQRWDSKSESVIADTTRGFYRVYNYSASLSFNTKLYGMYTFGKKKPVFLRHVFSPSLSANFAPDFGTEKYGYWARIQTNADSTQFRDFSPFSQEMYGVPGRGKTASLSFALGNTLELKVPSKKDTTGYRKVKIFESFNISSGYNFLLDSLNLSPFAVTVSTNLFNKLPLSFSAQFDPYALRDGHKINRFLVQDGGFLRMTSLSFSLGYSLQSKASRKSADNRPAINNPLNNTNDRDMATRAAAANGLFDDQNIAPTSIEAARIAANQYYDFAIPWSLSFSYSFNYSNYNGTPVVQQSVNFNGSVNLTEKWAVSGSIGYDFQMKKLTPGTIQITRDLHCWQMSLNWTPVGFRQSWSFQINVKSAMLSDMLKYKKENSFLDNYYRR
ncbi:MAG: putative LPS assembly protein LptD, partial [Mucinivorans sp.]